jgi:pimeloyl-ACP methyl ester carboxylesterase
VALLESIGDPVTLHGRSYGAIIALEAALLAENVDTLVLYEPPMDPDGFRGPPGFFETLEALLVAGDRDGVIAEMMTQVVGFSPEELAELRAGGTWEALVAKAHTLPREGHSVERYHFDAERLRALTVPTVLLEGDQSPDELRVGVRVLHEILPDSRLVTMAGVGHEAPQTGPEIFTATLLRALDRSAVAI